MRHAKPSFLDVALTLGCAGAIEQGPSPWITRSSVGHASSSERSPVDRRELPIHLE
jgi:hypothetical protein